MLISVIVTIRNEEHHIRGLLESLIVQEGPLEVLIIDAFSTDDTQPIVQEYCKKHDFISLYRQGGTRGEGRNFGIGKARGEAVAFIDGDCVAGPEWLRQIRSDLSAGHEIVAGKTVRTGRSDFARLSRVELFYQGVDLTFPSCNLAYKTEVVKEAGVFDTMFRTAEDIDLNYRAVRNGHKIHYDELAVVNHHERDTLVAFFKQAFWNGYGRKQLTLKHGRLWSNYSITNMIQHDISFWYLLRTTIALLGYATAKAREKKEAYTGSD